MKVKDVMKPGDTVHYNNYGDVRAVIITDVEPDEFNARMGDTPVWGRHTQVTHIRRTDGTGWSCHNGVAILD